MRTTYHFSLLPPFPPPPSYPDVKPDIPLMYTTRTSHLLQHPTSPTDTSSVVLELWRTQAGKMDSQAEWLSSIFFYFSPSPSPTSLPPFSPSTLWPGTFTSKIKTQFEKSVRKNDSTWDLGVAVLCVICEFGLTCALFLKKRFFISSHYIIQRLQSF